MLDKLFDERLQNEMTAFFLEKLAPLGKREIYEKEAIVGQDSCDYFYIVTGGCFKQMAYSQNGKEISFFRLKPGTIFGEMDYFDEACTIAMTKSLEKGSTVSKIHRTVLEQALAENPKIYRYIIHSITRKYRIMLLNKINSVAYDSKGQVCELLMQLLSQYGIGESEEKVNPYVYTHQELANSLGISRITVTNIINELKIEGIIAYQGKFIKIVDEGRLKSFYCPVWDE